MFETEYIGSTWDSASQTHKLELRSIQTGTTSQHTTDVLISANGPLSVPLLPRIPGLSKFKGPAFHNLHWRRNPIDFVNKRVAIVGNGSSGIQLLPGVAATPGVQLVQYIRSGGYYFPKNNAPIPSFRKWTYRYIPFARLWHRYSLFDAHNERWKTRNAEDSEDHGATEKVLLDYLKDTAPAEYLDALTPKYREQDDCGGVYNRKLKSSVSLSPWLQTTSLRRRLARRSPSTQRGIKLGRNQGDHRDLDHRQSRNFIRSGRHHLCDWI